MVVEEALEIKRPSKAKMFMCCTSENKDPTWDFLQKRQFKGPGWCSLCNSDNRWAGLLDLIHSDLCGVMSSISLTGFEYYVTFIDDFSKKTWIYFMNIKKLEEFLERLQEFKSLVENQTRRRIQVL